MERSLVGLVQLIVRLAMWIAIIEDIRVPVTQAHVAGLNITTVACQQCVDALKRLRHWHTLGQLRLYQ